VGIGEVNGDFSAGGGIVGLCGKHGGTGGCKARHRFKIGVEGGECFAEGERERAEEGRDDPNEDNDEDAFSAIEWGFGVVSEEAEEDCEEKGEEESEEECKSAVRLRMCIGEKLVIAGKSERNREEGAEVKEIGADDFCKNH
jgi:hypothetical protein